MKDFPRKAKPEIYLKAGEKIETVRVVMGTGCQVKEELPGKEFWSKLISRELLSISFHPLRNCFIVQRKTGIILFAPFSEPWKYPNNG